MSPMIYPPFSAMTGELRQIVETSKAFQHLLGSVRITPSDSPPSPPLVNLSMALDISAHLLEFGVSTKVAAQISGAYRRHALELRRCACLRLSEAWIGMAGLGEDPDVIRRNFEFYVKAYEQQLTRWTDSVLAWAREHYQRASHPIQQCLAEKKRPVFNHDYTPLLEKYFEYNPYPSVADRILLARKSMMTPRQIEVWFQNHRNRAKKEGKVLQKVPLSDASKFSFESLENLMGDLIRPKDQRPDDVDSDMSEGETCFDSEEEVPAPKLRCHRELNVPYVLDIPAPPHGFPCLYKPRTFSACDDSFHGGQLAWFRKPATSPICYTEISIDELIGAFTRLKVRDGPGKQSTKRSLPANLRTTSKPDRSAATCAITTSLPPAPHPAFVRKCNLPSSPLPSGFAASSHGRLSTPTNLLAAHVPPQLTQVLSAPTPMPQNTPKRRKVAPLPKRTPANPSIANRSATPASSPSPSRPPNQPSRTSSLESISSIRSTSSSSSSASTTVTTPASSPAPLPSIRSPSPSTSYTSLFGDTRSDILPSDDTCLALPTSFAGVGVKRQTFDFSYPRLSHVPPMIQAPS